MDHILAPLLAMLQPLIGLLPVGALSVLSIVWLNIVLSCDNAVVIALACRSLPPRQRGIGVLLGVSAATALRIPATIGTSWLLELPVLRLVGGLLVVVIAVRLTTAGEARRAAVATGRTLWASVAVIAIADFVMSPDNVVAIAAASGGKAWTIVVGLALSMPLVFGGAAALTKLLRGFPLLVWAAAALLGGVAGRLITEEPLLAPYLERAAAALDLTAPMLAVAVIAAATALVPLLAWIARHMAERRMARPAE